jgi:hypothetical protein
MEDLMTVMFVAFGTAAIGLYAVDIRQKEPEHN